MKIILLAVLPLLFLSGCSLHKTSMDEAAKLLGRSIQNVKTIESEVGVSDYPTLPPSVNTLGFKTAVDLKDPSDQRFKLEETMSGNYQNDPVTITAEIIGTNAGSFLRLKKVELPQGDLPNLAVTGEWYKLSNPQADPGTKVLGVRSWPTLDATALSMLREHVGTINFIQPQRLLKPEILYGKQTVHYLASVDQAKLASWLDDYEEIAGQSVNTAASVKVLANAQLEIWQNTKDLKPARIALRGKGLNLQLDFPKWNGQFVITEPQASTLNLDLAKILPSLTY